MTMANNTIKFYPVGNGDTSLITLKDGTTILIDCCIREGFKDSDGNYIYDVKADLLKSLRYIDKIPHLDLFILTHPDNDHCLGFRKHFYQGDPNLYAEANLKNNEIIIDEIWVTSRLFSTDQCDDANSIRNEVNRRKRLQIPSREYSGNILRLIGYDEDEKFETVKKYIPGDEITTVNNKLFSTFSAYIHAPFKDDLISSWADKERNESCIILQARFKDNPSDLDHSSFAIFGGDADHYIWQKVLEITELKNNSKYLKWDLLLAPHHCSWTFFNDVPYEVSENQKPKDYSLKLIHDYIEPNGKVISSSKKITDKKPNPPHQAAKDEYLKALKSTDDFFELAIKPSESAPEPIEFYITNNGVTKSSERAKAAITSAGALGAANTIVKNGI